MAQAIDATKPAYQVTPGIEGTVFNLSLPGIAFP